jgi:NAD(P)-dependent dehydrogenase (short-subunit alcohol dehydrogenase family)
MRTIFISGVNKGLGRALAERFLAAGDFVIGTYVPGVIDYSHEDLVVFPLDFYKQETIGNCIQSVERLNKKIDILINNAGVLKDEDDTNVVMEKLRSTLEVNLFGHIQITEGLIPLVNVGGHIINISSSAGSLDRTTRTKYPSYKISKAALNMYTRTLAIRLVGEITVSSVHPGRVKTDMGGIDAELTPEEAAEYIFKFAGSKIESGQFWYKGEKFPW